jgi:2-succinyl-5-enolpyruvyl-6-hydroxy-3-cyclohexene-1-carboxylate synthase
MDVTQRFAATFVDELAAAGVRDACLSPGSRSAPLAMALARHPRIRELVHVDERSGSFFALGIAKATGRPVALLCTSGTAAAEFHPAVVEAHHSRVPLVVLTADRPPELRDVGANQVIDQARLYGAAVRWFFDPGPPDDHVGAERAWRRLARRAVAEASARPPGPVHLNLPFREPLTPAPGTTPTAPPGGFEGVVLEPELAPTLEQVNALRDALAQSQRPLLVAGEMREGWRLADAVDQLAIPVLAEPTSQLRLRSIGRLVAPYEALLRHAEWAASHRPDLVIRLGASPTSKVLNAWLAEEPARTLLIDPDRAWPDPDVLATDVLRCDPLPLLRAAGQSRSDGGWAAGWGAAGAAASRAIDEALDQAPLHEGTVVRALARVLPARSCVFVGSSMPIRSVDAFWPAGEPGQRLLGNRGASGIDGLVSTGLGVSAASEEPVVLLLGDLSLYHDMNGLLAVRRHELAARIVVLDNGGGGIFSFLPPARHEDVFEELFLTPLGLDFAQVARLYGLDYCSVEDARGLEPALAAALESKEPVLLRVGFNTAASVRGHRACWTAAASALTGQRAQ